MKIYLFVLILLFNFMLSGYSQGKQLLIFVGKKIEFAKDTTVIKENNDYILIGPERYIITYQVLQLLKGNLEKDTVSCYIQDEFNTHPELTNYKHALVFLYKFDWEGFHHYSCMEYYDVYKTKDNRWASPYAWLAYYLCKFREDCVLPVKPQKILFEKEVSFDLSVYSDMEYIKRRYPSPYFDIKDNRAIAVYGHYLEDLLKLSEENFYSRGFIYENRKNTNSNTGYY